MKKFGYLAFIVVVTVIGYFMWPKKTVAPVSGNPTVESNNIIKSDEEKKVDNLTFPGVLDSKKISNKKAVIETTKGKIEFELYADKAPLTVSNFVYLAELGYYNGLTFHRVVPNFVIQGGDPTGTGTGGPGYKFKDETVVGEYKAGTVAMANSGPDSNGSQFFICLEDQPNLPKDYNLFGQVISGMDVVAKISIGDKMNSVVISDK